MRNAGATRSSTVGICSAPCLLLFLGFAATMHRAYLFFLGYLLDKGGKRLHSLIG